MSPGVNPALTDWDGAILTYSSLQSEMPGRVANGVTLPWQSIVSTLWPQYSVTIRSVPEAATPIGVLTVAKGVGLAAYRITASDSNPTIYRAIFAPGGRVFILGIRVFRWCVGFCKEKT